VAAGWVLPGPGGELALGGHKNTFTEIIGRHRPFGGTPSADIHSRAYTSEGDTPDYVYELDGDALTKPSGSLMTYSGRSTTPRFVVAETP
jgi:hypothetical protein